MSLTRGSVNALNVGNVRRLHFMPVHFSKMTISANIASALDSWVYQNLDSRYAIVKSLRLDSSNKLIEVHELGVEDAKELTIMSLSCPLLDKY
jgi:hypothetical protein